MAEPAFIQRGSKIWISYLCGKKEFVFYERIDDQEELEACVKTLADRLKISPYLNVYEYV
jgi:hypothetical protein